MSRSRFYVVERGANVNISENGRDWKNHVMRDTVVADRVIDGCIYHAGFQIRGQIWQWRCIQDEYGTDCQKVR